MRHGGTFAHSLGMHTAGGEPLSAIRARCSHKVHTRVQGDGPSRSRPALRPVDGRSTRAGDGLELAGTYSPSRERLPVGTESIRLHLSDKHHAAA